MVFQVTYHGCNRDYAGRDIPRSEGEPTGHSGLSQSHDPQSNGSSHSQAAAGPGQRTPEDDPQHGLLFPWLLRSAEWLPHLSAAHGARDHPGDIKKPIWEAEQVRRQSRRDCEGLQAEGAVQRGGAGEPAEAPPPEPGDDGREQTLRLQRQRPQHHRVDAASQRWLKGHRWRGISSSNTSLF